ncbi:MAG: prepilin-type N-terminal cleavage/methylation domain-containing protein [Thiotrichaceae bacterium]|nr:prepilin-type N-terminal cleavage/methylation domain-containing protein [Thiotrichaceae bacterium]
MQFNRGFTLIEVLIAMSLMSIMMLLLFASLRISARNWDAGEKRIDEISQMAAVQNFFQRHLSSVRPELNEISEGDLELAFKGDAKRLEFVASLPSSAARLGLQIFTVKLTNEDDAKAIVVGIEPFYPTADGEEWKKEEVILVNEVNTIKFSYFGNFEQDDEPEWHESWREQHVLPLLIKVEIEFENGIYWPAMIVSTRIKNVTDAFSKLVQIR